MLQVAELDVRLHVALHSPVSRWNVVRCAHRLPRLRRYIDQSTT